MRAEEFIVEMDRRGFLKGLAGFAASAAVPSSVVKLLSTPAGVGSLATPTGVSALGISAGLALLKGIQAHLDQYDAEDDDDYYEAWEDMSAELGFDATDAEGYYHSPLSDLLNLHNKNPKQAAEQLIKHVQSKAVDPADIKASFKSRADNPSDWRYHARKDREEPELTGGYGDKPSASAKSSVPNVATAPGTLARAAVAAKAGIDKLGNLNKPAQQVKPAPALSAPIQPEVELPVNVKQKQKVGQGVEETLEYKQMDPEFAAKAVTLLGLKGDQAYDDIKQLAIQMGQVREFRNLMNAAQGMAFSEFDTNPGDFKNWWQFARALFAKFAQ
jgi:hypothetical protein